MNIHSKVNDANAVDIPSRYTYDKNLDSSSYKLLSLVARTLFGVKNTQLPEETAKLHAESLMQSDTLADNVVNDLYCESGGGAKLFKRVMQEGLDIDEDIPESLKVFYNTVTTEPEWLDRARLANGIATSQRVGRIGMYGLAMLGLLAGYSNPDLSKPLIATGALTGDSTFNRVNNTASFWIDVTESADSLNVGGKAFNTSMHGSCLG